LQGISELILFSSKNPLKFLLYNSHDFFIYLVLPIANSIGKGFIVGSNLAIRKSLFNKVGGFPNYISEDTRFSKKLHKLKKIKLRLNLTMLIHYSSRRFDKFGYFTTIFQWFKGLLKELDSKEYTKNFNE